MRLPISVLKTVIGVASCKALGHVPRRLPTIKFYQFTLELYTKSDSDFARLISNAFALFRVFFPQIIFM